MHGQICYSKTLKRFYVSWYDPITKRTHKIYRYLGQLLYEGKSGEELAKKLLSCMQSDVERGVFRLESYLKSYSEIIPYLRTWLISIADTISPATKHDYNNSIENHLVPFFEAHPLLRLHDIQNDILMQLLSSINRGGKGKKNVIDCLRVCLDYACRSGRIPYMPRFPKKKDYQIAKKPIKWLSSVRQESVIKAISREHQPIFWWLKYHFRRPAEAMALHKQDQVLDGEGKEVFNVFRSFSCRQLRERTKTGDIHIIPMVSSFVKYWEIEKQKQKDLGILSPFYFVCPSARNKGRHYTHRILNKLWNDACKLVGEDIPLYSGVKHSSCTQLVVEEGYSKYDVQIATDHANIESVEPYTELEISVKRSILEHKKFGTKVERKSEDKHK